MSRPSKQMRASRRNLLLGLGFGAVSVSSLRSAQAQLLPAGRRTEKHDVIVIGTGMSGSAAALQAKQDGADVLALEKRAERQAGGNSRFSAGFFAVPSDDSAEAKQQYVNDFNLKAQGHGNPEIYKLLSENARAGVAWMTENGVKMLPAIHAAGYNLAMNIGAPGPYLGMPSLLGALRQRYVGLGGLVAYETKAKQLIMNDQGQVVGVRAVGPDGVIDYMAKAVVITAGGYAANKFMLEELVDPNADSIKVRGTPWATGDGLMMAREAGAGWINMTGMTSLHIAAVNPVETAAGNPFQALPFCLAINRDGKRYVDESLGYVANGKATLRQPGQTTALIFDEALRKLPDVASSVGTFQKLGLPILEANTIEELAGKLGVPPAQLVATVNGFNAAVEDGKAMKVTPVKANLANKLQTPKFYAFYPLIPGVTLTFGGIMITPAAQVKEPDGQVIAGLYAAGEGAGAPYFDDYVGGGSLANCLVMGRIAGSSAAKYKGAA